MCRIDWIDARRCPLRRSSADPYFYDF